MGESPVELVTMQEIDDRFVDAVLANRSSKRDELSSRDRGRGK
jgi:hypothetical protein